MDSQLCATGNDSAHNGQLKPSEKGETKSPPNTLCIKCLSHRKRQNIFHCLLNIHRLGLEYGRRLLSWTRKVYICIVSNSI